MRLSDQIRVHAQEVERLRNRQRELIRSELVERHLSIRAVGALVGKSEYREFRKPDWDPPQEILDELEAHLFPQRRMPHEPLASIKLEDQALIAAIAPRSQIATEIWSESNGVWTDDVHARLLETGCLEQSTLIRDLNDGLIVESKHDAMDLWRPDQKTRQVPFFERPDAAFNEFVYHRIIQPLSNRQPYTDRCWGWVDLCQRNLRYVATLLPFATSNGAAPDRVLSVVTSDRDSSRAFGRE